LDENSSDTWALSPMYLQLGFADGTDQVSVAFGRQSLAHRRQVRAAGHRRRRRATVGIDRHQVDHA